ncbi:MAG: TIGR02302 family protein [Pseudomonadota bacterium]
MESAFRVMTTETPPMTELETPPSSDRDVAETLDRRVQRAFWLAIGWVSVAAERLIAPIGELALWAALAAAVIGLDLLPRTPLALHGVALAIFALGLGFVLYRAVRGWRTPRRADAARRLERSADLAHRPLDVEADRPTRETPGVRALWNRHRAEAAAALDRLRPPAPRLAERQPTLWPRALIAVFAVVGVAVGWGEFAPRTERALAFVERWPSPPPPTMDAWIEPPAYTGEANIRLSDAALEPVRADAVAPQGSTLTVAIAGLDGPPDISSSDPAHILEIANPAPGAWRLTTTLTAHDVFTWTHDGETRGDFAVAVLPDAPPEIDFAAPPQRAAGSGALSIRDVAEDDYGVTTVVGAAALAPQDGGDRAAFASAADPLELAFAAPALRAGEEVEGSAFFDLTGHPWAGLEVLIRLKATDAAEQTAQSPVIRMVLPERIFNHPVARALSDARKRLSRDPATRPDVARELDAIRAEPNRYAGDIVVHMGLSVASSRLIQDVDGEEVRSTQDLLWAMALRLEDGGVSLAANEMRALQRSLLDALADENADDAALDALAQELREALDAYLDALREQMAGMDPQSFGELPEGAEALDGADLREMLERALEMGRTGGRDAAQQMLSQLQRMLENLRLGAQAQGEPDPRQQEGRAALEDLNRVIEDQTDLADRTFRDAERGEEPGAQQPPQFGGRQPESPRRGPLGGSPGQAQQGEPGGEGGDPDDLVGGPPASAGEQSALRDRVDEIMRRFEQAVGQSPENLGSAGRSMDDATDALGRGAPGDAVDPQADALSALQSGADQMADALAQQFGQGQAGGLRPLTGQGGAQGQGEGRSGRDPFGRRVGGPEGEGYENDWRGDIPSADELNRAKALVDEMRRRLGLPNNPRLEREYLRRLLERF